MQPDRPARPLGFRPSVLVVEDNPDTRLLVKRILQESFDVTMTEDGAQALAEAAKSSFHLVLMDISLGDGCDGAEVMKQLRGIEGFSSTPVVALTAYALPGDRVHFLNEGFDDYLAKPFRKEDLLDLIRRNLGRKHVTAA